MRIDAVPAHAQRACPGARATAQGHLNVTDTGPGIRSDILRAC